MKDGSSPLARGLREPVGELLDDCGIIPARAGFTLDMGSDYVTREDHPRSRGVYYDAPLYLSGGYGSSPLARGLPDAGRPILPLPGIIPARAGFTER